MASIDLFNNQLALPTINAQYRLSDNGDNISDNYALYTASKKTGLAKDDYPSQALLSNVKKINYEKFSLSCFSSAFIGKEMFQGEQKRKSEQNEIGNGVRN